VGLLVSGPHFAQWSVGLSLAVIAAFLLLGGGLGYVSPGLALGGTAGGSGAGTGPFGVSDGDLSGHHNGTSGGDGGHDGHGS